MARQQKGLPALDATNRELALSEMNPAQRARMASLGDATPFQMAQRAAINANQRLTGTGKQRSISVGQQLIAMGVGGIHQHPNFNFDTGYVKEGGQTIGDVASREANNSAHGHSEALDIGMQGNSPQQMEQTYQYLLKNKERFGISELIYAPKGGDRVDPDGNHWHHIHVAFYQGNN
jgi:hypothetical protein